MHFPIGKPVYEMDPWLAYFNWRPLTKVIAMIISLKVDVHP